MLLEIFLMITNTKDVFDKANITPFDLLNSSVTIKTWWFMLIWSDCPVFSNESFPILLLMSWEIVMILFSTFFALISQRWMQQYHMELRGFLHEGKSVHAFRICVTVILMTVFWPVCMQISITRGNLNCAIQMMVWRCFPVAHLSNHAAKSPYECLDL